MACLLSGEGHAQQTAPQKSRDNWDRMARDYLNKDYLEKLFATPENKAEAGRRTPARAEKVYALTSANE